MTTLSYRRARNSLIATVIAAAIIAVLYTQDVALWHATYTSGWLLFCSMLFLALYNARKKIPFVPLARSATWLQLHSYVGLITVVLFLMHTGFKIPNGNLEVALAILYIVVAGSGIFGLFLSRTVPSHLSIRGEEVMFERIPAFRLEVRNRARALALESVAKSDAPTIGEYYARRLAHFFEKPRHYLYHMLQSSRPRHILLSEIADLDRYLSPPEKEIAAQLNDLVCKKDDLDYSYALQLTLKGWLFVHIGLTYGLLMTAIVHATLAYAFHGGLPR
jgi:hypothetical protein